MSPGSHKLGRAQLSLYKTGSVLNRHRRLFGTTGILAGVALFAAACSSGAATSSPERATSSTTTEATAATVDATTFPDISEMPGSSPDTTEATMTSLYPYRELTKYPDLDAFNNLDTQTRLEHAAMLFVNTLWSKGKVFTTDRRFANFINPLNADPNDSGEKILRDWKSSLAVAGSQTIFGENEQMRIFSSIQAQEALSLSFVNESGYEPTDIEIIFRDLYNKCDGDLETHGADNYGLGARNYGGGYELEYTAEGETQTATNSEGRTVYTKIVTVTGSDGIVTELTFVLSPPIEVTDSAGNNMQLVMAWQLAGQQTK